MRRVLGGVVPVLLLLTVHPSTATGMPGAATPSSATGNPDPPRLDCGSGLTASMSSVWGAPAPGATRAPDAVLTDFLRGAGRDLTGLEVSRLHAAGEVRFVLSGHDGVPVAVVSGWELAPGFWGGDGYQACSTWLDAPDRSR